jgi:cytochrome c oxidase assembly protein subunit 15
MPIRRDAGRNFFWSGRRPAGYHPAMAATLADSTGFFAGRRAVAVWLFCVAAIIVAMVVIGGLTRLTGSGLSITHWDPIVGAIPPLSDAAWHDAFAKYQRIPQYIHENRGMTLDGFKGIFWWEWAHRLLGRIVGLAFALPCLWFCWTGAIRRTEWPRMAVLFVLGGLQGVVGWWMVTSGLETRVSVSQYRLAIHLGVAVILLGAILWTALEYLRSPLPPPRGEVGAPKALRVGGVVLAGLVYVQMLLGALVAGLHGGLVYNTWPSMDGRVLPEFNFTWVSVFEDAGLAQFDHRIGAYVVFVTALALAFRIRSIKPSLAAMNAAGVVAALAVFQVVLGIVTLISQVPIALAAAHQLTAALLFCAAVWQAFELRLAKAPLSSPASSAA